MNLELLRDRRVMLAAAGGGIALLAGLGIGLGLVSRGPKTPPPVVADSSAPGSLQVEMGREDPGLDPQRPLRCFVGGQFVGMLSLKDCAQKNGVATGSLDVGLDPSGQVAAAPPDAAVLQPLPTAPAPPALQAAAGPDVGPLSPPEEAPAVVAPASGPAGACWRFSGEWRKLSDSLSLDACVQALFAGRCERPGSASYGRWNGDTIRLVTGKVERSGNNRTFRTLVKQPPGECSVPHTPE